MVNVSPCRNNPRASVHHLLGSLELGVDGEHLVVLDLVGGDGLEEEAGVELPPGEGEPNVVHRADTRLPAHRPNTHLPTCTRQVKIIPRNNFIILCMPIIDQSRNKPLLDV